MVTLDAHVRQELMRALGVTRIARLTGLDRTGVEVACAVRPGGHVLQVCNGKGETFDQAAAGALSEAAELWGAERVDPTELRFASAQEMRARFGADQVWGAEELGSAGELVVPELWSDRTRCAWRPAVELFSGDQVWVPAQAVHCPPSGAPPLGPVVVRWTTNGSGVHPRREGALLHALLEAVERDQLARALPRGWTPGAIARRMIDPKTAPPAVVRRVEAICRGGFDVYLFDLTHELGLPVAGALLADRERGPVPLTAGYACALTPEQALRSAVLEAAQSRLTDIHGAREDVAAADVQQMERLRSRCARVRPERSARAMPKGGKGVRAVLERLWKVGHRRAAVAELAMPSPRLSAVKVIVPGLRVSGLL